MTTTMTNFRTITSNNVIMGERFYLLKFNIEGLTDDMRDCGFAETMYGTISYEKVQENGGRLMPGTNMAYLCADKSIARAVKRREWDIEIGRELSKYRECFDIASPSGMEAMAIMAHGPFYVADADTEEIIGTFVSFDALKAKWPAFELVGTNKKDTLYIH